MKGDFFKGIKQWEFEAQGRKGMLPVFYYDNSSMSAIYTAKTSEARKLLPLKEMNPVEFLPGRCLVAFTAFEYRKTDIDPYNEFSIAFLISYNRAQIPGLTALKGLLANTFSAYVWQLPVTTEIARIGGVELFGYPKFLAGIKFNQGKEWRECELSEGNRKILNFRGKVLPGSPAKVTRYVTYSVLDRIPLAANIYTNPLEFKQSISGDDAAVELGDHQIAETLKQIGLSKKPLVYQFSPLTEVILFGGRNLIDH